MLGNTAKIFNQLSHKQLIDLRGRMVMLLTAKAYFVEQIAIYEKAYDYFCENPKSFDGATIVKDLIDIPGLDLDAMLHDYMYLTYGIAANFYTKWKADWLYAKGQERKGKGQYSAFSRFVGLTIIGIAFVPYTNYKKGNVTENNKKIFLEDYKILTK